MWGLACLGILAALSVRGQEGSAGAGTEQATSPALAVSDSASPEADPEPVTGTVDGKSRKSVIRVAHDTHYPPFEYVNEHGESEGFGIDILREAAKRLGMEVEFVPGTWEEVLSALRTGKADLTPEMMHSEERRQRWCLGEPWGESWSVIFVRNESEYRRLRDLWGRRMAVPSGDIEQERLERLNAFSLVTVTNTREGLLLLSRGDVEALACNRDVGIYELGQIDVPFGRFRVLDEPLDITPYSVAGLEEKRYLIESVTEAIQEMKEEGSFEGYHWKWFTRPSEAQVRSLEKEARLRRIVFGLLLLLVLMMAAGFIYYRRQKHRLERLVRRRTKELGRSERHYRALFDHARDAIFLLNPEDRRIVEVNPSAEQMAGRSRRKLVGKCIDDLFLPEERDRARDLFERQTHEEVGSFLSDVNLRRTDGSLVVVQVRAALVSLKEGKTLYAVFRDVTETAQARREIEERNHELKIQNALALALQHDLPLGSRLGGGLDAILGLGEFQIRKRGAVFVQESGREDLILATHRGVGAMTSLEDLEKGSDLRQSAPTAFHCHVGLFNRAMQGELIYIEDCKDRLFTPSFSDPFPPHGHYVCPLRSEGKVLGVMCLFTDPHAPWDERRRSLLESLSSQLGIVVESEKREHALRDREHRLESMYQIAISLGSSLDLTEQLRFLFAQIRRVMPADAGNVWVADSEVFTGDAEVYYSYDTREEGTLVESTGRTKGSASPGTSIHKVFTTGEPILILRSEEEMQELGHSVETQFGLERRSRSLLYVPLKYKGRVIAVLTVQSYLGYAFTQETVDVLMSLSAPLAVVIENARLFETVEQRRKELDQSLKMIEADLKAAQVAQESLLPREFPRIRGWDFASVFIPSQYVGGDIYNVFQLDERHFGLYHIDVSGHGVPAALFSVGLNQYLMRDLLGPGAAAPPGEQPGHLRIRSPEEVVSSLDRENMFQKHQRFFTMLYLVADTATGRVRFYRAGHNEPLLLRPGEPPLYLAGGGPLIGFQLPRNRSELQEIQLRPGDRLVIYSDGINEAVDAKGNLYGLERMANYLSQKNGANLQSALDGLVEDVRRFSQSPTFEDDVSMVGFAWNPRKGSVN